MNLFYNLHLGRSIDLTLLFLFYINQIQEQKQLLYFNLEIRFLQTIRYRVKFGKDMLNFVFRPHNEAGSVHAELFLKLQDVNAAFSQCSRRVLCHSFQIQHNGNPTIVL